MEKQENQDVRLIFINLFQKQIKPNQRPYSLSFLELTLFGLKISLNDVIMIFCAGRWHEYSFAIKLGWNTTDLDVQWWSTRHLLYRRLSRRPHKLRRLVLYQLIDF